MKVKKQKNSDIVEAGNLFRQKKYGQVISLLSPQIFLYRKEPSFHELLAFSCLYTGDFGGAYSYFQRSKDLNPNNIKTLLGLGVVMLRRRQLTEALRLWLEVLDQDPDNKQAKKALDMAKILEEDDWLQIIEEGKISAILPPHPRFTARGILTAAAAAAPVIIIVISIFLIYPKIKMPVNLRPGYEILEFSLQDYTQGEYSQFSLLIFNRQQMEKELSLMEDYFHQFRDNLVRFHGNRLLLSNAPMDIKDRISILLGQLKDPDFTNFKDGFDYKDVSNDPQLYNGVFVQWRGKIANLQIQDDLMLFELLVGFETGRVLQGRVPVQLDFAAEINPGDSVEIIGRVVSKDNELKLAGSFIRIIRGDSL